MTWEGRRDAAVGVAAPTVALPLLLLCLLGVAAPVAAADPRLGRDAFTFPRPDMPAAAQGEFALGRGLFRQPWIIAPAEQGDVDGLGPLHNRLSCVACHPRNGRGAPPERAGEPLGGALVRLSAPGPDGRARPHPVYGDQLNSEAIPGVPAEGRATVLWRNAGGETLPGGVTVRLRRPELHIDQLAYGPLGDDIQTSLRVAPPVFGLGLLEDVPATTLAALAAAQTARGDGISGRVNRIPGLNGGSEETGRFGLKANQPGLLRQNAGAFIGDLGITSPLFPDENCTPAQSACAAQPHGGAPELTAAQLNAVTTYTYWLAAPPRRNADDPAARAGETVFAAAGCAACHVADLAGVAAYTDLLLHDMGDGLADGRPDHLADGREWRTAPLWGLGLAGTVGENPRYLHDGRARDLMEAVLWHDGEAAPARDAFRHLPADRRDALLAFLNSL